MARRAVEGVFDNGAVDIRLSRRGFDAMSANPADRRQISFAASRGVMARFALVGEAAGLNQDVFFGRTFPVEPPLIFAAVRRNGIPGNVFGAVAPEYFQSTNTKDNTAIYGSPIVGVIYPDKVRFIHVSNASYGIDAAERYRFAVVE